MKRLFLSLAAAGLGLCAHLTPALADEAPASASSWARPMDVSLDGHRSDWLFYVTTVSITVLFIIMVGLLLWTSLMHKDKAGRTAHYEHGTGRSSLILTGVISSIIFFGVDGTLLYNSFKDLSQAFYKYPTKAEAPVTIEVFAQQWSWNFRYPGADGVFNTPDDILSFNDMYIPENTPVFIKLKSKDVIHSFYLPNFRTKQDAFPGAVTQLWFQGTRTGDFEIGCAQHCGVSHYKMRGFLHIRSKAEFEAWLKSEETAAKLRYDEKDEDAHWGWDFWSAESKS